MPKRGILAVVVGLVALGVAAYLAFRPSDESRIRDAFARTVKACAVKSGDTPLSRLARLRGTFAETTSDDVRVHVDELGISVAGRKALSDAAAQAGLAYTSADAEVVRAEVVVDPGRSSARVDATLVVTGSRGGATRVERRAVHALFRNDEGWRLTSLEVFAPEARR